MFDFDLKKYIRIQVYLPILPLLENIMIFSKLYIRWCTTVSGYVNIISLLFVLTTFYPYITKVRRPNINDLRTKYYISLLAIPMPIFFQPAIHCGRKDTRIFLKIHLLFVLMTFVLMTICSFWILDIFSMPKPIAFLNGLYSTLDICSDYITEVKLSFLYCKGYCYLPDEL